MGKTLTVHTEKLDAFMKSTKEWLHSFFKTIDNYETIAVAAIGLGIILIIVGIILL